MAAYTSIAAWQAAQAVTGPELLVDLDCTAIPSANWLTSPPTTFGGIAITHTITASPTTWGPDGSTGIVLTGVGNIKIDFTWAALATALMNRTVSNADRFVFELDVDGYGAATVNTTKAVVGVTKDTDDNNSWVSIEKSADGNRETGLWNGASVNKNLVGTLPGARTMSLWVTPVNAFGNVSDSAMASDRPLAATVYANQTSGAVELAVAGAWNFETAASFMRLDFKRATAETAVVLIKRFRVWLIGGTPNSA